MRLPRLGLGDDCMDCPFCPPYPGRRWARDARPRLAAAAFSGWRSRRHRASDHGQGPSRAYFLTQRTPCVGKSLAWDWARMGTFPGNPRSASAGPVEGSTPCRVLSF